MRGFLTSIPNGTILDRTPSRFHEEYGFLAQLSAAWPEKPARCVLICAEPEHTENNDEMAEHLQASLALSGLTVGSFWVCDSRQETELPRRLADCDVLILSGGHTLTQNRFFRRLGLRKLMQEFDGLLLGISGGSMNCASTVYAQPEWPGDTVNPDYQRFPEGLGLMDLMLLPHYQVLREQTLDGLRLVEDVALPDSAGRTIYGLPDGSYVCLENGRTELRGPYWVLRDGVVYPPEETTGER